MNQTKPCLYCGRSFEWRKKWEECWDEVKFCSDACRKSFGSKWAQQAEDAILKLLQGGKPGQPHNPDEAARMLVSDQTSKEWRAATKEVMNAARRLVRQQKMIITRKGKVVEPDEVRGVVRFRTK